MFCYSLLLIHALGLTVLLQRIIIMESFYERRVVLHVFRLLKTWTSAKKKKSYLKRYIAELCDLLMSHLYEDQGPEGVV